MSPVILYYDKKNKNVHLLSNLTYNIETTWENCELVPKTKTAVSEEIDCYHILNIDLDLKKFNSVVAVFPFDLTILFYQIPKKLFILDDIDWSDGNGY
jgi:hypothetical protein